MRRSRAIQKRKPCVFLTYKFKTVPVLVSKRITYIYFLVPVGLKDYRLVCIWTETTTHGIFVCIHFLVTTRGEFKAFKRFPLNLSQSSLPASCSGIPKGLPQPPTGLPWCLATEVSLPQWAVPMERPLEVLTGLAHRLSPCTLFWDTGGSPDCTRQPR